MAVERKPQSRSKRGEIELVGARSREAALVEVRALVLVAVIDAHRKLRLAEALHQRYARARAVAAREIERRPRAAPVGSVLIEADRGLDVAPAGEPHVLPVGPKTKIERAFAERQARVEGVVLLLVAVVGAVAVGGVAVHRAVHAQAVGGEAAGKLAFDSAVAARAAESFRCAPLPQRRARHDVDHAGRGIVPVQYRAGAAQDLDALDRRQRDRRPLHAGEGDVVQPPAVEQDQRVLRAGRAEPAQVDGSVGSVVAEQVFHREPDLRVKQLGNGARGAPGDLLLADHGDARRQAADVLGKARGGDDNGIVLRKTNGDTESGEEAGRGVTHRNLPGVFPDAFKWLKRLPGRSPDSRGMVSRLPTCIDAMQRSGVMGHPHSLTVAGAVQALHLFPEHPGASRYHSSMKFWVVAVLLLHGNAIGQIKVVDDYGHQVSLSTPASRIVSLAPHLTELLYAAGAGPKLVGAVAFSDFPPEARALPRVGNDALIDLEVVLALRPDLIVAWPNPGTVRAVNRLAELQLPVFRSEP